MTESRKIIPLEWIQVLLLDGETDSLREAALYSLYHQADNHVTPTNGTVITLDNGSPLSHVWKNQALLHVSDTSRAAWVLGRHASSLRSLVVIPLRTARKRLGIISLGHARPFVYSETDAIVLQQLSDQVATAIDNASLYAQSRRGAHNEALINDIAIRLLQQSDIEDMLQIAAIDLGKALGARRARVRLGARPRVETPPSGENGAN